MKWQEVAVTTSHEAVELLANFFHELGSGGVVIEDPLILQHYTVSGQWEYHEIPLEQLEARYVLTKGYLPVDPELPDRLERLKGYLNILKAQLPQCHFEVNLNQVNEADWANSWKEYFKPNKISPKVVIVPSWEEYCPVGDEKIILLDPGMAFGTGTHETTKLCVQLLEKAIKGGETVFDVGTGSGVLSLAAVKLGAAKIYATDIDRTAVETARRNAALNGVEVQVAVRQGNFLEPLTGKGLPDLIVANIAADAILLLTAGAYQSLRAGGIFIVSGIILERQEEVANKLQQSGFAVIEQVTDHEWAALMARK